MTRERPRTNQLVHGRIYPDDADTVVLVRTAPPTPEAIAAAQMDTSKGRRSKLTYAERVERVRDQLEAERCLRDATQAAMRVLRERFVLKRLR